MFLLVTGAGASGKSTFARALPEHLTGVVCHDADEMLAEDSDTRCAQLEIWVQRALREQRRGRDFLLTTHSPLGELLACPSAPELHGIAACLLDCADPVRAQRYIARGINPRWPLTEHTLNWARWHRQHAANPGWEPHVIERNGPASHRYDRWRSWAPDDPRWQVHVIDSTALTPDQTLPLLLAWVADVHSRPALLGSGTRWWELPSD